MSDDALAGLVLAGIAGIIIFLVAASVRRRKRNKEAADEARRRRWAVQDAEEEREEGYRAIRHDARERARIAYPELLDKVDADTDDIGPFAPYVAEDRARINEALSLVIRDIERIDKGGRTQPHPSQTEWLALEEVYDSLMCALFYDCIPPKKGQPSAYLDEPVRIIDCGVAGKIELYPAAQVEAARERSGRAEYVDYLERRYDAPNVASRVLERAKKREEQIEREKREAEEAITTKLDDLPPLPPKP